MRYIVQFADKTTKRITKAEADQVIKALAQNQPIILRGAYFNPRHIVAVKPISKDWFDADYTERERAIDGDRSERGLPAAQERVDKANADFLGITQAKEMHETPSNWTKAGDVQ